MSVRSISYKDYKDKVLGGWMGKSLGGIIGAPFEGHKIKGSVTVDNCWPQKLYPNDDLDIQVVWLEMLEERGAMISSSDLVEYWQDRCWYNFAEYGSFLYNVQRGIHPPLSGRFNNAFYRESMGCPIRAEIWGLVCPGNSGLASEYARIDGELDHIDNSVWAEQFWAACDAEAFFTDDIEEMSSVARQVVPRDSDIFRISNEVAELWSFFRDWERIWRILIRRYGHRDGSKVEINFAFTLLALYAGGGDFKETIVTALNCGWDVDCTAATAGALLGIAIGASGLPEDWIEKMGSRLTCDVDVRHRDSLLSELSEDTCAVGLEVAEIRNHLTSVTDVPGSIRRLVDDRLAKRPDPTSISISTHYLGNPSLGARKRSESVVRVSNAGDKERRGELRVFPNGELDVSPRRIPLVVGPNSSTDAEITVSLSVKSEVLWDKNLISVEWVDESGDRVDHICGFAGSRYWRVYGPYWDAWDKKASEICPYRNDQLITHPAHVPGCGLLLTHQYADLDTEYLDESKLLCSEIWEEDPYVVSRDEDHLDSGHLGGFTGEACFYLVREIVASESVRCNVAIGCTGPFKIWLDGEEMLRNDRVLSWSTNDWRFKAEFDEKPRRLVMKCVRPVDDFRCSLCFMKIDVPGDKKKGISYLIDKMGDVIPENVW